VSSSPTPNGPAFRRLWLALFLVAFPLGILAFVLPIYGRELGASAVEVGAFFSAFSVVPVIVRPILGRALDRWGRRPFLLLGLAGYAAAMGLFVFADSIVLLTIARFIQGLGQAFLWLSAYTIVADLAAVHGRGRDFGSIDESVNRGALVGTMAGFGAMFALGEVGLTLTQSWPWIFALYALPALAALGLVWRGVPETKPAAALTPVRSRPLSPQLLALMGIVAVTGASNAMVWPLLMIFLQDSLGAGIAALTMAYLPAAILSSILPSRMGRFADRLGRKPLMVAGLAGGALASALIPHLRSLLLLAGLWAVESVGYAASVPAERAFVADIAGEDTRGTSYGLYTFAYFLGSLVGPVAGGWLYDNYGHATPFYLNTAVLLLGAALVVSVLRETRVRERPAAEAVAG
jgi:MFS family permease